jgi:hypothetical protein
MRRDPNVEESDTFRLYADEVSHHLRLPIIRNIKLELQGKTNQINYVTPVPPIGPMTQISHHPGIRKCVFRNTYLYGHLQIVFKTYYLRFGGYL